MASLQRSIKRRIKRGKEPRTLAAARWLIANATHLEELRKQREVKAKARKS
jgi:hypothetical protein